MNGITRGDRRKEHYEHDILLFEAKFQDKGAGKLPVLSCLNSVRHI